MKREKRPMRHMQLLHLLTKWVKEYDSLVAIMQNCDLYDHGSNAIEQEENFYRFVYSLDDFRVILAVVSKKDFDINSKAFKIFKYTQLQDLFYMIYKKYVNLTKAFVKRMKIRHKDLASVTICDSMPFTPYDIYMKPLRELDSFTPTEIITGFNLGANFFLNHIPYIEGKMQRTGPIYDALVKRYEEDNVNYVAWDKLSLKERYIKGWEPVVENFILTGEMLVEMRYITDANIRSNIFNTSTKSDLLKALQYRNLELIALYIHHYPELSDYAKRVNRPLIMRRFNELNELTKKHRRHFLRQWMDDFIEKSNS